VDETKIPTRPFLIRCPKCNSSVDSGGPSSALEQSAITIGNSPATENPKLDQPNPAPLFELPNKAATADSSTSATEKLAEVLSSLLSQPVSAGRALTRVRSSSDPRKVLLCVPEGNRESIARDLAEDGYQVFVAQDTRQAVDRMRENELDMVLLDPRFDPVEQGAIFVTREVNILRPAQRRRLFFVLLSPSLRTMDAHTAFLNNVNAIVNVNDLEELPRLLERRVREYNELYKEFHNAIGVPAL
jgi:CheY-like chemotaxis protein